MQPRLEIVPPAPRTGLSGRVALVTGGGRGIGRLVARDYARAGASVALIARSADELAETVRLIEADGGVARAAVADVRDHAAFAAAVRDLRSALGPVDVLVNNAGIVGPIGPSWEVDLAAWWQTMEVNVLGTVIGAHLVLPEMVRRGRGRIINLASQAGAFRWPLVSAYSVSKASIVKFTENLARESRRHGITVFSVHPGLLPIGMTTTATVADDAYGRRIAAWVEAELRAGRGADPDDAVALLRRVAVGDLDALSGQHLSVHDDLEARVRHATEAAS